MFLATSKDVWYLVISVCAGFFTIFLCWTLYYLIKILRDASHVIEEVKAKLDTLTSTLTSVREKMESLSGIVNMFSDGVMGAVKKIVARKADEWVDRGTESLNNAAKDAVDKAVNVTAEQMKKMTNKIKK